MADVDPDTSAVDGGVEAESRSGGTLGRYRKRWSWDRVTWGTHCLNCLATCPYRVYSRDGAVLFEEPAGGLPAVEEGVPDMNPLACQKGSAWSRQLTAKDRILHPMRRVGERGGGEWERISWDEALEEIAHALVEAIDLEGPESVVFEETVEGGLLTQAPLTRFAGLLGAVTLDANGLVNDFPTGHHMTFGKFSCASTVDDTFHSDVLLLWHSNPAYTSIPYFHFVSEARYRGAQVVAISPDYTPSAALSDMHVPIRPGTDAALALAMCNVIAAEDLADWDFVRSQTDLPLLVLTDSGSYLRGVDVEAGEPEDRFYHWDPEIGLVPASRKSLDLEGAQPCLEGTWKVTLVDGAEAEVTTVYELLKERFAQYTPEAASEICGVAPDVIRRLARTVAAGRTKILEGFNACKYYHGDLIERAMCLLLGVTGNWGKNGTGIRSWTAGMFDGQGVATAKTMPGIEGTEMLLSMRDMAIAAVRQEDPTLSEELAVRRINQILSETGAGSGVRGASGATMSPLAFWWYWQAGFKERWNKPGWGDDSLPRTFDEYFDEALQSGWWTNRDEPRPESEPRVLVECGGNMFRRTRGGRTALLETLWPKLKMIVSIDFRMSSTGLWSDILLPAAQHYEKVGFHIPTPHVMNLTFSDRCATPAGEAKPEWEIYQLILAKFAERAAERGIATYSNARQVQFTTADACDRYTLNGYFADEDRMADEILRDCAYAGTIPEGTSLATMREKGSVRFIGWGLMPMALAQASPFEKDKTHSPFRNHVEDGQPFPTYSRRAQFYIDHPWWLEAGEELPVHKPNPLAGGDYPCRMTSGHNRWSIHSMNQANPVILQTHRGEPAVEVNDKDAEARGVADDDFIRVWNDIASFTARAKVAPGVRPGQIISYNGWDGHQYQEWMGANEIEAGMVKWIAFAGGYGHINYTETEWQPIPTDRGVPCDFEKAPETGDAVR